MDPLHPTEEYYRNITRRQFFDVSARTMSAAMGAMGIAGLAGAAEKIAGTQPGVSLPSQPHFRPKAKRVIYMHMSGAPSQIDLFDYKPALRERFDQDLPESIRQGQRLTTMTSGQNRFPVAPSIFRFSRYPNNQDGAWVSELMPHTGSIAKELCFIKSMHTDAINHEPGITFFQTGSQQPGRASFGAWTSYGLGSGNANLPSFVVLITQGFGNMQALITAGQIDFGNGTNAPFNSDGYAFECEPSSDPSQVNYAFVATANPINPGSTGERNFVMDINGLVHFKTGEEILAASLQPACEVPPGCSVAGN